MLLISCSGVIFSNDCERAGNAIRHWDAESDGKKLVTSKAKFILLQLLLQYDVNIDGTESIS